jgi:hypothetical protein
MYYILSCIFRFTSIFYEKTHFVSVSPGVHALFSAMKSDSAAETFSAALPSGVFQ